MRFVHFEFMRSVAIGVIVLAGCGGSATGIGREKAGGGGSTHLDDGGTSGAGGSTGGRESTGGRGPATGGRPPTGGTGGVPPRYDAGPEICQGSSLYDETLDVAAYLLFDASKAMNEASPDPSETWWQATESAAIGYASDLRFHGMWNGVQFYPRGDGDAGACEGRYDIPAIPLAPLPGPDNAPTPFDGRSPGGENAPGQALAAALGYMKGQLSAFPFMKGAVVLVTSSAPADCADTDLSTLAAVGNNSWPPVKTYVVALGNPAGLESLDALAVAGGTEKALVLPGKDLRKEFSDAMTKVRYAERSCTYDLPENYRDPSGIQVYATLASANTTPLPFVDSLDACDSGGVVYQSKTDDVFPPKITLCPQTCVEFAGASMSATLTCAASESAARSNGLK
jgi:hypothetical protein